ncbi:MAG: mechanosensitive ion channel [Chromatiaceae bacterium]|nr:mechanosensitive ion channel [Chromatiaceae bacterium]
MLFALVAPGLGAQTEATHTTAPSSLPSSSQIETRIAETEAASALDTGTRNTLIELYRRALANLETKRDFERKAADFASALKSAPTETSQILDRLKRQPPLEQAPQVDAKLGIEAINRELNQILADLAVEEARLDEFDKQLDQGNARPTQARARITEIKQTLDSLTSSPAVEGESPELTQARAWATNTQREALWAETRMLEQELLSQPVRLALYQAQRDETAHQIRQLQAHQRALEEALNARRAAEAAAAREAAEQAQREAEDKHPLVGEAARENAHISDALSRITTRLDTLRADLAATESARKRIEEEYRGARQRLEAVGLTKALGQVLIDSRTQLPDVRQYRKLIEAREDEIAEASLRQIRYREDKRHLRERERYLDALLAAAPEADTPEIRAQLAPLLDQREQLIAQALDIEDDYIRQLGELNFATDGLIQVAGQYDNFLAERLLWVRSAAPIGLETLRTLPDALLWLFAWENWRATGAALAERLIHALPAWLGLGLVALLYLRLSWLRRTIRACAEPLRRVRTDAIRHTLKAIGLSLIAALPLPLLLWLLGQQLLLSTEAPAFARAFGGALSAGSFGLYYLLAFRALCISGGVAERHFRWNTELTRRIRRDFDWFIVYILPVVLVALTIYNHNDPAYSGGLGRLALVASMLGFSAFFWQLLHPTRGIVAPFLAAQPSGWINGSRLFWFPLIVATPLALAALALVGYVYTAGVLFQSLVSQTWLALALVVLHQTIVRWLMVARRRLALQAALERLEARRAQAESEAGGPSEVLQVEESEPNLAALDEQTRRLINAVVFMGAVIGLWITWSDVLPAFNMLERFTLWQSSTQIDGAMQSVPVTAADIGLVVIILFVATVAAKNLPALIEIMLLQSETVSAGGRYAIKTLASYSITAVAFLLAFSTLGLNWSQVQWLVAALSVGIGFGLQEIVANFISGIIILFERPVRVGDIVTIGDTTGVVTNIQIRATTIRNWDKQELLVPNKEFITGRLLNWTLTDQQNRVTVPVGVEYGCDTRKALELLAEVAERHEKVLADPAPLISFESFGDNALVLYLRCYLESLDGRIAVITELHQMIYDSFAEHGIGIAFPQRDVHLAAKGPLDVRLHRAQAAKTAD